MCAQGVQNGTMTIGDLVRFAERVNFQSFNSQGFVLRLGEFQESLVLNGVLSGAMVMIARGVKAEP